MRRRQYARKMGTPGTNESHVFVLTVKDNTSWSLFQLCSLAGIEILLSGNLIWLSIENNKINKCGSTSCAYSGRF